MTSVITIGIMATESGLQIGRRVIKAREARGWNQATLARKAKVSPSYVSRLEAGEYPSPSVAKMASIATALGLRVSELVDVPAAVPPDLLDQLRALVGTDDGLLREVFADLNARPPEERPGALRFVLEGLRLTRSVTRHN